MANNPGDSDEHRQVVPEIYDLHWPSSAALRETQPLDGNWRTRFRKRADARQLFER